MKVLKSMSEAATVPAGHDSQADTQTSGIPQAVGWHAVIAA